MDIKSIVVIDSSRLLLLQNRMRVFNLVVTLAFAWANQAFAIYPDDHWNYSTRLTEENFDSFVQGGIDSGKTVVRQFATIEQNILIG
jgi:hypothetical protein